MKRINITKICIMLILIALIVPVSQAAARDYTLHDGVRTPIPESYTLSQVINNTISSAGESTYFNEPNDLFINEQGFIFIVDTGNNRIVKLDEEGNFVAVFNGPEDKMFFKPQGVYVDEQGNLYVADTGNSRIVHLSSEGEYVEEFIRPESDLLGESFTFEPSKILIGPTGYIYVTKGQTIFMMDAYNRFRGYVGQTEIGYSLVESLLRMFASDEQKRVVRKRTAASYINMTMDKDGMLYATSLDRSEGEIKKLNSVGNNIYRKYGKGSSKLLGFLTGLKLESDSFYFGERVDDEGLPINPIFKDIAVDENGIVTVVEEQTAKIYQYDPEGNLLTVFGGRGVQKGKFNMPSAIAVDKEGRIYVLDRVMGNLQIFRPTGFIEKVHEAILLYSQGKYEETYEKWQEVLKIDENFRLAHQGIANSLYKKEQWEEAMEEYVLAEDRQGYSKAFLEYRYDIFREHFALVALIAVISVLILIKIISLIRKISENAVSDFSKNSSRRMGILEGLKMSFGTVFHPAEVFDAIKNGRGRLNVIPGMVILGLVLLTRVFYLFVVHYPLADVDIQNSNLVLEAVKLLLPILTWVVASFAVTAILDGESKISEIFLASTYCMIPYILTTLPLSGLSRILSRGEVTLYAVLINGTWLWILLLVFISLKRLNDYSFIKAVVIYVISGLTMVLVWLVSILGYVLIGRLCQFVSGVFHEIKMALQ